MTRPNRAQMFHKEADFQKVAAQWLDIMASVHQFMWFHPPNGGWRDKRTAARFKGEGVKPGVSDIIMIFPPNGHVAVAELKSATGQVSVLQRIFMEGIEMTGGEVRVCYTLKELTEFVTGLIHKYSPHFPFKKRKLALIQR